MRRDLAELSTRPEGYIFAWIGSDGRQYTAPLLTPPDLEAVQRSDGTWHRVARIVTRNEPAPYTQAWYAEYLRHFGLPSYFLRPGHLAMLSDDYEANMLGLDNAPSSHYAVIPPQNYLDLTYTALPLWPEPSDRIYQIEGLTKGPRANMSRYNPALSITTFPYNIYVWPRGAIQVRSTINDGDLNCPVQPEDVLAWEQYEEGERVPSSYHLNRTGRHPRSSELSANDRRAMIQYHIDHHAVINPTEDVPGVGRLGFLHESDAQRALEVGHVDATGQPDAHQVILARRRGELAMGTGQNAGPIVVFQPNAATLNPREDPAGTGRWEFLTSDGPTSNRGLAAINFGGSHSLPNYPTAGQIRRLGQMFIDDGREDLTAMIDLVWVAGEEEEDEADVDPVLDAAPEPEDEPEDDSPVVPFGLASNVRSSSAVGAPSSPAAPGQAGLPWEPTNGDPGGPHDQTGGQWPDDYDSRPVRSGFYVTIDRARAQFDKEEPWKLWTWSAKGWKKWQHADAMDWKDKKKVSSLNKFREQTNQRAKWEPKRKEARPDYTKPERAWIMALVKDANGERPTMPLNEIAAEFVRRFPAFPPRSATGIQSLIDRSRIEFKENGGLKERHKRGHLQSARSKASRGAGNIEEPEKGKQPAKNEEPEESEESEESEIGGDDEDDD